MDREQNPYRSGITRRQFLTAAVMGLTVAYLAPKVSYTQQEGEIDVTVGIVTALASEWVEREQRGPEAHVDQGRYFRLEGRGTPPLSHRQGGRTDDSVSYP